MIATFFMFVAVTHAQDVFLASTRDAKTDFQISENNPVSQPEITPEMRRLQERPSPAADSLDAKLQAGESLRRIEMFSVAVDIGTYRVGYLTGFQDGLEAGNAFALRSNLRRVAQGTPANRNNADIIGDRAHHGDEEYVKARSWREYADSKAMRAMEHTKEELKEFKEGYTAGFDRGFSAAALLDVSPANLAAAMTTTPTPPTPVSAPTGGR